MLVTIKKNIDDTWAITPNSGRFSGFVVATAEVVDLTSVETYGNKRVHRYQDLMRRRYGG